MTTKLNRDLVRKQGNACIDFDFIENLMKDMGVFVVRYGKIDIIIRDLQEKITNYYKREYPEPDTFKLDFVDKHKARAEKIAGDMTLRQYQLDLNKLERIKNITTNELRFNLSGEYEKIDVSFNYNKFFGLIKEFDITKLSVNKTKYFIILYNNLIDRYSLKHLNRFVNFICSYRDIDVTIFENDNAYLRHRISEMIIENKMKQKILKRELIELKTKQVSSIEWKSNYNSRYRKSDGVYTTIFDAQFEINERAKKLITLKEK